MLEFLRHSIKSWFAVLHFRILDLFDFTQTARSTRSFCSCSNLAGNSSKLVTNRWNLCCLNLHIIKLVASLYVTHEEDKLCDSCLWWQAFFKLFFFFMTWWPDGEIFFSTMVLQIYYVTSCVSTLSFVLRSQFWLDPLYLQATWCDGTGQVRLDLSLW